jgi:NADP-dependent 3-hydroxy acid dehydrogenase YdfG
VSGQRAVVVTGASTGIGYAIARVLVDHGVRVFGSVRRVEDGHRVRRELGDQFVPLMFDVTSR